MIKKRLFGWMMAVSLSSVAMMAASNAASRGVVGDQRSYLNGIEHRLVEWDKRAIALNHRANVEEDVELARELTHESEWITESVKEIRADLTRIGAEPEKASRVEKRRIELRLEELAASR